MNTGKTTGLNFGEAIEHVKNGKAVRRAGWGGKKRVFLNNGNIAHDAEKPDSPNGLIEGIRQSLFNAGDTGTTLRLPAIHGVTSGGANITSVTFSQPEILAEDWELVND